MSRCQDDIETTSDADETSNKNVERTCLREEWILTMDRRRRLYEGGSMEKN